MQQFFSIAVHLGVVAWVRTVVVIPRRSTRVYRWVVELGFGLLIALPLLGG